MLGKWTKYHYVNASVIFIRFKNSHIIKHSKETSVLSTQNSQTYFFIQLPDFHALLQ